MMNFSPSTNLTEVRDRMIGVVLGILVYTVVSTLIWPEREGKSARNALADLLEAIGKLLRPTHEQTALAASATVAQQQLAVMTKLGKSEQVLARVALEPRGRGSELVELTLTLQTILAQARSILAAVNALQSELDLHGKDLPVAVRDAVFSIQEQAAAALDRYASDLRGYACQSPAPIPLTTLEQSFEASLNTLSETQKSAIQKALEDVVRQLSTLPNWGTSVPTPTGLNMVHTYG